MHTNLTDEEKEDFTGIGAYETIDRQYIGDYIKGKEHGIGLYGSRFNDGNYRHCYVGEFNNDKVEGMGIKSYNNTELYCGEYKNNERNGIGYWKLPTGASFIGEHKNHIIDGFGVLITWEGLKFIGKVRDWRASDIGQWYDQNDQPIVLKITMQRRFVREFKTGYSPTGDKYAGEYKHGKRHGTGTLTWPDGTKYVGEFSNDMQNGQGTETYPDGSTHVGKWKDGKRHGHGTRFHIDGSKYVGTYRDDMKYGGGIWTYK